MSREFLTFKNVFIVFSSQNKSDNYLRLYIKNLKNLRIKVCGVQSLFYYEYIIATKKVLIQIIINENRNFKYFNSLKSYKKFLHLNLEIIRNKSNFSK